MPYIKILRGKYFPKPINLLGIVAIVFGIIGLWENIYIGIVCILIGIFFFFSIGGIIFKPKNSTYRLFIKFIFTIYGKPKSYEEYSKLCLIRSNEAEITYGGRTNQTIRSDIRYFDICLMTEDFRERIVIKRFNNVMKAEKYSIEFSNNMGIPISKYSPEISRQTRSRR